MHNTRNIAGRILALLLALVMVAAALPATAATSDKKAPEDVLMQWYDLQDKWMAALENSNFTDEKLEGLIEDIYYNSALGSGFTLLNIGVVGVVEEEMRGEKDGSYQMGKELDGAEVTKKEGKYSIAFEDKEGRYKVTYSENTGALHAQTKIGGKQPMTIYSDIIPARGGIYTALVVAVEGEPAVSISQYMNDSMVYFTFTEIGAKENPADYRLLKTPQQYAKLKGENSAAITLTDSGRLTLEYQEYVEHFQSK